jgi:hypothetical protein
MHCPQMRVMHCNTLPQQRLNCKGAVRAIKQQVNKVKTAQRSKVAGCSLLLQGDSIDFGP